MTNKTIAVNGIKIGDLYQDTEKGTHAWTIKVSEIENISDDQSRVTFIGVKCGNSIMTSGNNLYGVEIINKNDDPKCVYQDRKKPNGFVKLENNRLKITIGDVTLYIS